MGCARFVRGASAFAAALMAGALAAPDVASGQSVRHPPGSASDTGAAAHAAAAGTPGLSTVAGVLTYAPRIALPPGVTVQVDLVAVSRDASMLGVVAAQRFRTRRQVPIPFVLTIDPTAVDATRRHAVRARIQDPGGRVLWATRELVAVDPVAGARSVELRLQPAGPVASLGPDERPSDGGRRRTDDEDLGELEPRDQPLVGPTEEAPAEVMPAPGTVRPAPQAPGAALPAPPPAAGAPPSTARAGGATHPHAEPADPWQEARRRGVAFRAVGRDPGWTVEIRRGDAGERVELVDAEGTRLAFPGAEVGVETTNARLTWRGRAGGHEIEVVVDAIACTDSVTRERLEATVAVHIDGRSLRGCGRALL